MRKLFALLMALTMAFQLAMPAWADTMQEPQEMEEAALEQTQAPAEETEAPVEETEAPTEETEAPVEETEAPTEETEAPTEETEAPTEETEAPTEETQPTEEENTAPTGEVEETPALEVGMASGTCGENLTWVLDPEGTLTVSGEGEMDNYFDSDAPWADYREKINRVVLEPGITTIGVNAFLKCTNLKSVEVPDSVKEICGMAFRDCASLESIRIPEGVTYIFKWTFAGCGSLKSVDLPESLTDIHDHAFYGCTALTDIQIPQSVTIIAAHAFQDCASLESIEIPDSVTTVGSFAFSNCDSLKTVTIPGSVTSLGDRAFAFCDNLQQARLEEGVAVIEEAAFSSCGNLRSLYLPASIQEIQEAAFLYCGRLGHVYYAGTKAQWAKVAAYGSEALKNAVIHFNFSDQGEEIDSGDFGETLHWSLDDRGALTISGKGSMPNDAPWSSYRNQITRVVIEEGVTSIGSGFSNCYYLQSVTVPGTVTEIGAYAFDNCVNLSAVNLSEGLQRIRCGAFFGCSSLTQIDLPDSITEIESEAFRGAGLRSVRIPKGVTVIKSEAFLCGNLEWVEIPGGVKCIEDYAFGASLKDVYYEKGPGDWKAIEIGTQGNKSLRRAAMHYYLGAESGMVLEWNGARAEEVMKVDRHDTTWLHFAARLYPENTVCQAVWSSSDPQVASVDGDGNADLYMPGTTVIRAEAADGSGRSAQVTLQVIYLDAAEKLTMTADFSGPGLEPGQTAQLTVRGTGKIDAGNLEFALAPGQSALGTVDDSGLFTAGNTPGKVTVTAALKGDPLGRTASLTIPLIRAQVRRLEAVPVLEDIGELTQEEWYTASFCHEDVADGYRFPLRIQAWDGQGEPMESAYICFSTDTTVAKVNAKGQVTVPKGANGRCFLVIQAKDTLKTTARVCVEVRDFAPRLETDRITVNSALQYGGQVGLIAAYGNNITSVSLSDERFESGLEGNRLNISCDGTQVKNGTYSVTLEAACANGRTYIFPLRVKVTRSFPKVTVRQLEKFDLFHKHATAAFTVSVEGNPDFRVEIPEDEDFAVNDWGEGNVIAYRDPENVPDQPKTKVTLWVWVDDYRDPAVVTLNLDTVSTAPTIRPAADTVSLNTALTQSRTVRVPLECPDGWNYEWSLDAWSDTEGVQASVEGNQLYLTLEEAKNTTALVYLRGDGWAYPLKLSLKITVTDKMPTLKAASDLKLSALFTQRQATADLTFSQGNLVLQEGVLVPLAKEGTPERAETEKLSVGYDVDSCQLTAAIRDPEDAPKPGTYRYGFTGTLENGTPISGGTVKVVVEDTAPKAKLSASSVRMNRELAGSESASIWVTMQDPDYYVTGFENLPECLSFDGSECLTVRLPDGDFTGGSYSFYLVVCDGATGQQVTLPTPVSFRVQTYRSDKLTVKLTPKGKLDIWDDSSAMSFTVESVTNCLNNVDGLLSLEGPDAELFTADLDTYGEKPVITLRMASSLYVPNTPYRIQFRFSVCGRETVSSVQKVRVTAAPLKVTSPGKVTYCLSQTDPLLVKLNSNLQMYLEGMTDRTSRELQQAIGSPDNLQYDWDGTLRISLEDPSALKPGRSYSLWLNFQPQSGCATPKNLKSTAVRVIVKVMK